MLSRPLTNALRGIAILLITISHLIGGGFLIRYFTPLGGIGVAIFLFLSGYGLNESFQVKGLNCFWGKKVLRIIIPYLIWCLVLSVIKRFLPIDSPSFRRYWYLEYLFMWYLVFWFTKKVIPQYASIIMVIIAIGLFPFLKNLQTEQTFSFVLGVVASEQKRLIITISNFKKLMITALFLCFGLGALFLKQIPSIRAFGEESVVVKLIQLGVKLPIGLSVIIGTLLIKNKSLYRSLGYLGIVSLELYLVQMPFPEYVQSNWIHLLQIVILVAFLTLILYFLVKWTNTFIKQLYNKVIKSKEQTLG